MSQTDVIQQTADALGIPREELEAQLTSMQGGQQEQQGTPGLPPLPGQEQGAETAEGVRTVPAESDTERLQRENAVLQQELQQTRALAQTVSEGRVIGSSGIGPSGQQEPPNIGSIEPGIRWAYFNGLISDADLTDKVGPLLADLLKAHMGGAI